MIYIASSIYVNCDARTVQYLPASQIIHIGGAFLLLRQLTKKTGKSPLIFAVYQRAY
jgi:hypothetical protein